MRNKLTELAIRVRLGWKRFKENLTNERGETVNWLVLVIVGIILLVGAYLKFKGAGGDVGTAITNMGTDAANGLNSVRVGP